MSFHHGQAFPVPQVHVATLDKEIKRLVKCGVLELKLESKWAAPMFTIPKKNETIRFNSDI